MTQSMAQKIPPPVLKNNFISEEVGIKTKIISEISPYLKGGVDFSQEGSSLRLSIQKPDGTLILDEHIGSITFPYGASKFSLNSVLVYPEHDRTALDIACHAWIDYQNRSRACEKLRFTLEGSLFKPSPPPQVEKNVNSFLGSYVFFHQGNNFLKGKVVKITRLTPSQVKEIRHRSNYLNELTNYPADINLIICSRSLPGDELYQANLYLGGYPDIAGRWILSIETEE